MATTARRKGSYGIDAPPVAASLAASAVLAWVLVVLVTPWWAFAAVIMTLSAASFLQATLRGKFAVWAGLLDGLDLTGDEQVLDLGCGRGAVLLMAAQRLRSGTATGVDLWRSVDQSGNDPQVTLRNAELEGVADRVRVETGDLTHLPFEDVRFDLVLSSLAIHNIHGPGRLTAIDEAVRVLRPGGRLVITDISAAASYADRLRELGLSDVSLRSAGLRMWFGGPWVTTRVVRATKPGL